MCRRGLTSISSGFVRQWLERPLVPLCWKALESTAAAWNSGDTVRVEVRNQRSGEFVVDEISKSGKICGEILPDALHCHTHVGVSHHVAKTDDGPPWNRWMAFLEITGEPAGGIGENLHPPDYGVLQQVFGEKSFSAASRVLSKKVEALSDEGQQLIIGAHSTRASRKSRVRVRIS